jgi:predicted small lipoprotein YifL
MSKILAIFLALALTACGYKGPLEMPPGPAPEPLLGNPKPAKPAPVPVPAKKVDPDLSTDKKALPQ